MQNEYIKSKFSEWTENTIASFSLHHLRYIRTFSVQEFKDFFNIDEILVKAHPSGVLYFTTRVFEDYGLCCGKSFYKDPVISVVSEYFGHCFFLLHSESEKPQHICINSKRNQERLNRISSSKANSYHFYQSYDEYQDYIEESYMDAFEGDPDAYWNID